MAIRYEPDQTNINSDKENIFEMISEFKSVKNFELKTLDSLKINCLI